MSQRVKIRLSGARVIPRNAISLEIDWSKDFAVIESLLLSREKLPQNVQEDSGVLITLLDGDSSNYFSSEAGTVSNIELPDINEYTGLFTDSVKLLIRIFQGGHSEKKHKLLARTKQAITMSDPSKQVDNQGILKVLTRDLGNDNLWELFFDEEDGFPILRLNNKDGVVGPDMVKDDFFRSTALPTIIENILKKCLEDEGYDTNEMKSKWVNQWAKKFEKEELPVWDEEDVTEYRRSVDRWARGVAENVMSQMHPFGRLTDYLERINR